VWTAVARALTRELSVTMAAATHHDPAEPLGSGGVRYTFVGLVAGAVGKRRDSIRPQS
jgi:hypothetical protein